MHGPRPVCSLSEALFLEMLDHEHVRLGENVNISASTKRPLAQLRLAVLLVASLCTYPHSVSPKARISWQLRPCAPRAPSLERADRFQNP